MDPSAWTRTSSRRTELLPRSMMPMAFFPSALVPLTYAFQLPSEDVHEQIALFDDAFHFRGAVSGALDGDDDLTLLDGDGKVPDDARVGVIERVRDAEQGRRLAQRLPVAFFRA